MIRVVPYNFEYIALHDDTQILLLLVDDRDVGEPVMEKDFKSVKYIIGVSDTEDVLEDFYALKILNLDFEHVFLLCSEVFYEEEHDVDKGECTNNQLALLVVDSNFMKTLSFHLGTGV
jgi:hypothetical protein